jgi:hypothetical protein
MAATDLEQDARDIIEFFILLAEQDAALLGDFLTSAGLEPGTSLPQTTLMKLGVFCRLALWEEVGLTACANHELPSSHAVFEDALAELEGKSPEFDVIALCERVHTFAIQRLVWPQTSGPPAFTLDDRADASDVLDCVAELLWTYRHLADGGASVPPKPLLHDEATKRD